MVAIRSCRRALLLTLPMLVLVGCASARMPLDGREGGASRSVTRVGEGPALVVLESGLGRGRDVWTSVIPLLAPRVRVLAYDRAGLGDSPSVAGPRSAGRAASELGALLDGLGERGPVILVGHSYGGLVARILAARRPEFVRGLVLVEATHEDYPELEALLEDAVRASKRETELSVAPAAARSEHEGLAESRRELAAAGPLPPIPLVVVSAAGRRGPEALEDAWAGLQAELVELSPRGRQLRIPGVGHDVPFEAPAAVGEAVFAVLEELSREGLLN